MRRNDADSRRKRADERYARHSTVSGSRSDTRFYSQLKRRRVTEAIADRLLDDPDFQAEVRRLRLSLGAEGDRPVASGTNLTEAGTHLSSKFALGRNWRGWLMFCLGRGIEGDGYPGTPPASC